MLLVFSRPQIRSRTAANLETDESLMAKTFGDITASQLRQLATRLHRQNTEIAILRMKLDLQFKRISQIQAELDVLPAARKRRQSLRVLTLSAPSSPNGNGRSHS